MVCASNCTAARSACSRCEKSCVDRRSGGKASKLQRIFYFFPKKNFSPLLKVLAAVGGTACGLDGETGDMRLSTCDMRHATGRQKTGDRREKAGERRRQRKNLRIGRSDRPVLRR